MVESVRAANKQQTTNQEQCNVLQADMASTHNTVVGGSVASPKPSISFIRITYVPFVAGVAGVTGEVGPESFFDFSVSGKG